MRIFCHINEMGANGWLLLPALLVLVDEVVLWAPAGRALADARLAGAPLGPRDVLSLVKDGAIKIAARQSFLEDKAFRNSPDSWPGQRWYDGFDDEVQRIWNHQRSTSPLERKIIRVDDEDGYRKADEDIIGRGEAYNIAVQLLESDHIPLGTRERIIRKTGGVKKSEWSEAQYKLAIRELLRDAHNHEDARRATQSITAIHLAPFPTAEFNSISGAPPTTLGDVHIDRKEIIELFRWVGSLSYAGDINSIRDLRSDPRPRELIWRLLLTSRSPLAELRDRIEGGLAKVGIVDELIGTTHWAKVGALAGLLTAGVGVMITEKWLTIAGIAALGAAAGAGVQVCGGMARRASLIKDDLSHTEDKWLYKLAIGTSEPTRKQIKHMIKSIDDVLSRG